MFEKFKQSEFGKKCDQFSNKKGAVITIFCLVLAMSIILLVSIATNRAKEKYGDISSDSSQSSQNESSSQNTATDTAPQYNDTNANQVGGVVEEELSLALPVSGTLFKEHDSSIQVWSATMEDYRVHLGIDITTPANAPVYCAADGTVSRVWDDALMGKCVAISHGDDVFTIYKNLSENLPDAIVKDAKIKVGDILGSVGETAIAELADEPHLHFEMTIKGLAVDPMEYFKDSDKKKLEIDTSFESSATTTSTAGK